MIPAMLELVEELVDTMKITVRKRFAFNRLQIVAYPGFRNEQHIFIRGRVLVGKDIESSGEDHGKVRNFRNMAKRFFSTEIRHARLQVEWQGKRRDIFTDHEGFFFERLPVEEGFKGRVRLRLEEPKTREAVETEARIYPMAADCDLLIVSDVDDTILLTMARRAFRMLALTMFGNAHQRQSFAGVAAWYHALRAGADGKRSNPFFYVSSSPWNLYDFLEEFLQINGIPPGPFFLRDHGLSAKGSHRSHKMNAVEQLMEVYPGKPFLLIGDSGQHDPEIYRELVKKHPDRVRGVLIRNVTNLIPARNMEVERIGREIEAAGCNFKFFERTEKALEMSWRWRLVHPQGPMASVSQLPEVPVAPDENGSA